MAVGFVASATSGSQASVASFNIGTLGTGARCGLVFVATHAAGDIITGVTWNGVAMTRLFRAEDTDTEPGSVVAYFLDNVTNGTITVSRTNNASVTVGYAVSISAAGPCQAFQTITRVAATQNTDANTSTTGTGASGEVAVSDGSPGTNSMRFAAAYTGAASPVLQGTNSTLLQSLDSTALGSSFVRETTAGQGSRNVGFATGTTDDWALVAVAVRESPPQTVTLGLLDASAALYAPTIAGSSQSVTLGLLNAGATLYAPIVSTGYPREVFPDTPTSYWRLGEASGTVVDSAGSNSGSTTGTVTRDAAGLIGPDDDGAVSFAASSYISGSLAAPIGNVFSVEAWVKLPASGTTTICPFSTKGTVSNISMEIARSGGAGNNFTIKGFVYDGATYDIVALSTDLAVAPGGTYHIVWTRAGTLAAQNKIYVNGVDVSAVASVTQVVVNSDTTFYIGGFEGTAETWVETIDEVALYNGTALSAARVLAHYNAGTKLQTLTLGLLDSGAALYAPTLVGKNAISLGLLDAGAALYAVTLTTVNGITIGLLDASATLYAPTLEQTGGATQLTLDLLDAGATLYAPTVSAISSVSLGLLDSSAALYAPSVTTTNTISLGLLDAANALYAPTLSTVNSVTLGLLDAANALYAPTLIQDQFVTLDLLDAGNSLYAPTFATVNGVTLPLLDAGGALYAPDLIQDQFVTLPLLDSGPTTYAPSLAAISTLTFGLLDAGAALYAPTVIQDQFVTLPLLDGAATLYDPTITVGTTITFALLDSGSALYAPTILQQQILSLPLLDATAALYAPTVVPSAVTIDVGFLDGSPMLFAPTVEPAATTFTLDLLTSDAELYAPLIDVGAVTIGLTLLDAGAALYAPTIFEPAGGPFGPIRMNSSGQMTGRESRYATRMRESRERMTSG